MTKKKMYKILLLISIIGGIFIFLVVYPNGIGLNLDSVGYISGARNIIEGDGFLFFNNDPIIVWPPFYSIILGILAYLTKLDPLVLALPLNSILFGCIIFLAGYYSNKYLKLGPIYTLYGALSTFISVPLVLMSTWALTEILFICLILWSFILMERYKNSLDLQSLIHLGLIVSIAVLTKYLGFTLILWGLLIIPFIHSDLIKGIKHSSIFALISGAPVGFWSLRNYYLSGTMHGERAESFRSLLTNIELTYSTLFHWFIPFKFIDQKLVLIILVLITVVVLSLILSRLSFDIRKKIFQRLYTLIIFLTVYIAILIYLATTVYFDAINDRLLSPVFIPSLLILIKIFEIVFERYIKRKISPSFYKIIVIVFSLWIIYPALVVYLTADYTIKNGRGYNAIQYENSDILHYLKSDNQIFNSKKNKILSNGADLLYIKEGFKISFSPRKDKDINLENFRFSQIGKNKAYLIWFDRINREYLYSPTDFKENNIELNEIYSGEDGKIWEIK